MKADAIRRNGGEFRKKEEVEEEGEKEKEDGEVQKNEMVENLHREHRKNVQDEEGRG